jgi:alpha-L-fucosidase
MLILVVATSFLTISEPPLSDDWKHPLVGHKKLGSPLVEVTPFVFKERLYLLENWQKQWEFPGSPDGSRFQEDEVRIRDLETDHVVSTPFVGHGLGMALVDEDRVYVFAGDWGTEKKWRIDQIEMVSSTDLVEWSEPAIVLRAAPDEKFFNVSVCRGESGYVMLVESNDPAWPAFTFKYFRSDDLRSWKQVSDALYGEEKYVGGPALYFEGGWYYTLYLESLGERRYETRVTRSKDLVHWQDAPNSRPFATFDPESPVHSLRPPEIREKNASDAELCAWQGKTIVYYTGGDQQLAGDLQVAEYPGSPRALLESFYAEPKMSTPSANQLRYQEKQLGAFVHFGPASFIGGGDYLTPPPLDIFNPELLDAEQWVRAAKAVGAQHIVLTAKHHNGFCLWPTESTDYSVRNVPWKEGKGDVVREFVDAARKYGLAPGLYVSAADDHWGCTSTMEARGERTVQGDVEAYFPVFMQQLTELLTNYGPLEVIWFDGAYNPFDEDVLTAEGVETGSRYSDAIDAAVRKLQPNAVVVGAAQPDIRWPGNEQGLAPYPLWYELQLGEGRANWLPSQAEGWFIPEAIVHTRQHWFWAPDSDGTLKTQAEMLDIYHQSIGRGANLLINLTPDTNGLVPDAEVAMLEDAGRVFAKRYGTPVASITSEERWEEGDTLRLDLGKARTIDRVSIEEDLRHGQRVRAYQLEYLADGDWKQLAEGRSIGRRRIETFSPETTSALRLRVTDSAPLPRIRQFTAFGAE